MCWKVERHRASVPLDDVFDAPPVSAVELGVWSIVFGVQVGSGVPILHALDVTYRSSEPLVLRELCWRMFSGISCGRGLKRAVATMPVALTADAPLGRQFGELVAWSEKAASLDEELVRFGATVAHATLADVHRTLGLTELTVRFVEALVQALETQPNLPRALGALYTGANDNVKPLARELYEAMNGGRSFGDALAERPDRFGALIPALARAGTLGRALGFTLSRIVRLR